MEVSISDEREMLLGTGGAIKKAEWFLGDMPAFLVFNADIITDLNLHALYKKHIDGNALEPWQ